jgi:hypothetical protein
MWRWNLFEWLIVLQLTKKLCYGTQPHLVLVVSQFTSANIYTTYLSKLHFNNIVTCTLLLTSEATREVTW